MTTQSIAEITVADAAERLGVSERTVWRYLKADKLSARTVGDAGAQRTLIDAASVDQMASEKGRDPQASELREERDRLANELAQVVAERDRLRGRISTIQRTSTPPRLSLLERAVGLVLMIIARAPRRGSASAA